MQVKYTVLVLHLPVDIAKVVFWLGHQGVLEKTRSANVHEPQTSKKCAATCLKIQPAYQVQKFLT